MDTGVRSPTIRARLEITALFGNENARNACCGSCAALSIALIVYTTHTWELFDLDAAFSIKSSQVGPGCSAAHQRRVRGFPYRLVANQPAGKEIHIIYDKLPP